LLEKVEGEAGEEETGSSTFRIKKVKINDTTGEIGNY